MGNRGRWLKRSVSWTPRGMYFEHAWTMCIRKGVSLLFCKKMLSCFWYLIWGCHLQLRAQVVIFQGTQKYCDGEFFDGPISCSILDLMRFLQLVFLILERARSSNIYIFFSTPSSKYHLLKITVFIPPSEVPIQQRILQCIRGTFLPAHSRTDLKMTQATSWAVPKVSLAAVG